jgi:hypothetical protein
LQENEWIAKTNISGDFSFDHMEQFVELWIQLPGTRLDEAMAEDIFGKLSSSDRYSVPWAYKLNSSWPSIRILISYCEFFWCLPESSSLHDYLPEIDLRQLMANRLEKRGRRIAAFVWFEKKRNQA